MTKGGITVPAWAFQVRGLTKSFGSQPALRGIDLQVSRGESVAVFGPNGAGKTTLIRVLATILKPTSGEVIVDGLCLPGNAEEIRRRIGIVTHQTYLYGNLTAYENLDFYGRMYDVPRRRERVEEVVAQVGLTHRLHDRVGTLSRGMQQRLSIARALLPEPDIMLLDEAETGLDPQSAAIVWGALQKGKAGNRTIILTTHSLGRGLEMASRMLIMSQGKIAYESPRQALDLAALEQAYQACTGAGS